jgi:hypothetical protein
VESSLPEVIDLDTTLDCKIELFLHTTFGVVLRSMCMYFFLYCTVRQLHSGCKQTLISFDQQLSPLLSSSSSTYYLIPGSDCLSFHCSNMAVAQKLYPRATVKRIVKAHSRRAVSKNADIQVSPAATFSGISNLTLFTTADLPRLYAFHAGVSPPGRVSTSPPRSTIIHRFPPLRRRGAQAIMLIQWPD